MTQSRFPRNLRPLPANPPTPVVSSSNWSRSAADPKPAFPFSSVQTELAGSRPNLVKCPATSPEALELPRSKRGRWGRVISYRLYANIPRASPHAGCPPAAQQSSRRAPTGAGHHPLTKMALPRRHAYHPKHQRFAHSSPKGKPQRGGWWSLTQRGR